MADVPLFPSLAAVIVAEPGAFAVTRPLAFTVAIAVSLDDQVTARPESGLPFASFGVAVSCTVCPTCPLADDGVTVTEATGTGALVTVIVAVPLFPSLVAVIVAEPAPRPVTSPLPLTRAIVVSSLAQVTTLPDSGLPFASLGVALSCTVCPTGTLADDGVTVTDATGTGALVTVMVAVPLFPSLVAVIVAVPAPFAVPNPVRLTVATVVSLDDQVTARPESGLPLSSLGVALSCTVRPTGTLAIAGLTVTVATAARQEMVICAVSDRFPGWLVAASV